jgi:hypothetical protein
MLLIKDMKKMYYLCMCILVAGQKVIACKGFHDTNNFLNLLPINISLLTDPFLNKRKSSWKVISVNVAHRWKHM